MSKILTLVLITINSFTHTDNSSNSLALADIQGSVYRKPSLAKIIYSLRPTLPLAGISLNVNVRQHDNYSIIKRSNYLNTKNRECYLCQCFTLFSGLL
ncbi:MAG: hypothetical protein ACI9FO_000736 [Methylophagaceae bacterium]|jgi:hypothetical protein